LSTLVVGGAPVTTDHRGLVKAIQRHFQGASWQRCQVHFLHNVLGKVARKRRKALASDLKAVVAAPTKDWLTRPRAW